MDNSQPTSQGLTRRELLKRGAALGGALAWATPAVQLIGMTPAMASHTSGDCFCFKWSSDEGFLALSDTSNGECLRESDAQCATVAPPLPIEDDEFEIVPNNGSYTLIFPASCDLVALSLKCGGGSPDGDCDHVACACLFGSDIVLGSPTPAGKKTITLFDDDCKGDSDISHLEFCFQC